MQYEWQNFIYFILLHLMMIILEKFQFLLWNLNTKCYIFLSISMSKLKKKERQLKCARSDNSGEYRQLFEKYFSIHGIRCEKTVLNTSQHNGIVERMNGTIVDRIWCILSYIKLPRSSWDEAVRTGVELINGWVNQSFSFSFSFFGWWCSRASLDRERCFLQPFRSV